MADLQELYWQNKKQEAESAIIATQQKAGINQDTLLRSDPPGASAARQPQQPPSATSSAPPLPPTVPTMELVDRALGVIATLAREGALDTQREDALVSLALQHSSSVLLLAKHYGGQPHRFLHHITTNSDVFRSSSAHDVPVRKPPSVDVVVVGGGLAGLSAALTVLDRGGSVTVIEKEVVLGGNSAWASSGINGVHATKHTQGDSNKVWPDDDEW